MDAHEKTTSGETFHIGNDKPRLTAKGRERLLAEAAPALLAACQMALEVIRRNDLMQQCENGKDGCIIGIGDVLKATIRTATATGNYSYEPNEESGDGA